MCNPPLRPFRYLSLRIIPVYHPAGDDVGDPATFTSQRFGTIFSARMDGARLLATAWCDIKRTGEVDERVLAAIMQRTMLECSVGVYCEVEEETGDWNGE